MMSSILNKTFNLAVASLTTKSEDSVDTTAFIQAIEQVENKSEHICKFLDNLKRNFSTSSSSLQYKYLTLLIYCAHLGNESTTVKECVMDLGGIITSYIEQSKDVWGKKLGYSALTTLVDLGNVEIVYLAVNTILKEITSNNKGFIVVSLNAVCQLVTTDLVPVLLPVVERRLTYKDFAVRICAFKALECIYKVGPEFVKNTKKHVKLALTDCNPEVMASALPYLYCIIKKNSGSYQDLPPVLISILKQVTKGKVPLHMTVQGVSAPFVQINILKMLQHLNIGQEMKELLADVLLDIMKRCQIDKQNIARGILAECIDVSLRFYNNEETIFTVAVESLKTFFDSTTANYLFMGISLLAQVAKINPAFCVQYQSTVLKCLTHTDKTIKKQTLMLLQVLINEENCKVICKHMLSEINKFDDDYFARSFSENLARTAVKHSPDLSWLLKTLHSILEESGSSVSPVVSEMFLEQVTNADSKQLTMALEQCLALLGADTGITYCHFEAIVFVLSKFLKKLPQPIEKVFKLVLQQSKQQLNTSAENRKPEIVFILVSFAKQTLHFQCSEDALKEVIDVACAYSRTYPALQQSLNELEILTQHKELLEFFSNDVEFDDSWLSQYQLPDEQNKMMENEAGENGKSLKVRPYSMQKQPNIKSSTALMTSMFMQPSQTGLGESFLSKKEESEENVSVWAQGGYQREKSNVNLGLGEQNVPPLADPDEAIVNVVKNAFSYAKISTGTSDDVI